MVSMKKWLSDYSVKTGQPYTHLSLNGGKYNIPKDKEMEFISIYSENLLFKGKMYLVEHRPEIFRYMIDLDIVDDEYWDIEKIKEVVKLIQTVIYDFYEMDMNAICCTCEKKNVLKDGEIVGVKTGVHVIYPRHFTKSEDAIILRLAIIQKLIEIYGEREKHNKWTDVVDERIYTSCGFRMVGSDKRSFNRETKTYYDENRIYMPVFIMDSNGDLRDSYLKRLLDNYESMIIDTSIRVVPISVSIPFIKIPKWVFIEEKILETASKNRRRSVKSDVVDMNSVEFNELIKFMKIKLPEFYKNQSIKSIQRYPDGNLLIIPDTNYCMNIGREHSRCGIYFFGCKKGIYQKCLCPCDNLKGRIFGYCKDYTSSCFEFTDELRDILFPSTKITKKSKSKTKSKTNVMTGNTKSKDKYCKKLHKFCENLIDSL